MKFFFIFLLVIVVRPAFCQTSKAFVNQQGTYTTDSTGAIGYILFKKCNDTTFHVKLYSFENDIAMDGYYKDSLLTIPNGEFTYYTKPNFPGRMYYSKVDTSSYISRKGSYLNGMKSGLWMVYKFRNVLYFTCFFNNGKLNGLYQEYSPFGNHCVLTDGNYVDNMREGEWKDYDTTKNILTTYTYKRDILINTVYHTHSISPPAKFDSIMTTELHDILSGYRDRSVKISFTVDTDGTVGNVQCLTNISAKKIQTITAAILKTGRFKPAIYNDKPYINTYIYTFYKKLSKEDIDDMNASHRLDGYSKHANYIGRGLNTMGIGKPIKDDDQ